LEEAIAKFVKYGEIVLIEIDTKTREVVVLETRG